MLPQRNGNSRRTFWPIQWCEDGVHCDTDLNWEGKFFHPFWQRIPEHLGFYNPPTAYNPPPHKCPWATKYLDQFPVHPFVECNITKWGNQKPVSLEETGRAPGLEWDTGPRGKAWHSSLAWPDSPLGSEDWCKLNHLCSAAPPPSEGRSAPAPASPKRNPGPSEASRVRRSASHARESLTQLRPTEPASSRHPRGAMNATGIKEMSHSFHRSWL